MSKVGLWIWCTWEDTRTSDRNEKPGRRVDVVSCRGEHGFEMLEECLIPNCSHLGMQGLQEFAGGIGTRLGNHLCRVGKWSARCERTFRGIARRILYKDWALGNICVPRARLRKTVIGGDSVGGKKEVRLMQYHSSHSNYLKQKLVQTVKSCREKDYWN